MKTTIILNSHSLSDFQQCEYRYLCTTLISLEPVVSKKSFAEGTFIHRWLHLYYYHKQQKQRGRNSVMRRKVLVDAQLWQRVAFKQGGIAPNRAFELFRVLSAYSHNYKNETWETKGTEVGFSKVLFEDAEHLFIYEGKIDWLGIADGFEAIADHKSRSGKYAIYEFNNQCIGYLWATGAKKFIYNFLTMTNVPSFERAPFQFTDEQIEEWKHDTIKWYFKVAKALGSKEYLKSRNCSEKYGVCEFHSICETPRIEQQLFVIKSQFKQKPVHRSW